MKKKLTALAALCSLGSAAFAQSVTVYGLMDIGVSYVDNVTGHSGKFIDNGIWQSSRLGFRGAEDLGGGLRPCSRSRAA